MPDLDIIASDSPPDLTKRGWYPKWSNDAEGRGSLVWFNQASMIQSAEIGYSSITAAQKAGAKATTNFQSDADKYFAPATFLSPPYSIRGN
ncbi:hypothetical protein JVT61DRAFT_3925 [Boletus reticuloceps]|uniref:Uncharacterized protein n=1 Tax=Boletus reticuloceps TaxID=495285 RepID=A0A8I2YPA7_9AGAM|nr:hypothetical protein JVT61DRAFT_3925 [Boletus reticuloceps]